MPPTLTTRCRDAPVVARAVAWLVVLCLSALATEVGAKTPGGVHCYGAVCHRVKSLAEIGRLVGSSSVLLTSYYDDPSRDRFTAGHVTSSGETFNAGSPAHAASANFPDGTELLVWNPTNGRAAHIRVNDFGPFKGQRTLDVTRRVAEDLGFLRAGTASLHVVVIAAPDPIAARYSRTRKFAPVSGFLGQVGEPDLPALAARLIADAGQRAEALARKDLRPAPPEPSSRNAIASALGEPAPEFAADAPRVIALATAPPADLVAALQPPAPPETRSAVPIDRASADPVIPRAVAPTPRPPPSIAAERPGRSPPVAAAPTSLAGPLAGAAAFLAAALVVLLHLKAALALGPAMAPAGAVAAAVTRGVALGALPPPLAAPATVIGAGVCIAGTATAAGDLVIDGIVDGDCRAGRIVIGPAAIITGDVIADEVHVMGTVAGCIAARRVRLDQGCHVAGDVRYALLTVHPDARLEGVLRYRQ